MALECLVPPDSTQVPAVLEKCLHYIEDQGLFAPLIIYYYRYFALTSMLVSMLHVYIILDVVFLSARGQVCMFKVSTGRVREPAVREPSKPLLKKVLHAYECC